MPLPVPQSKLNAIRQDLLCKDGDRETEAMAQLYDIPATPGYDNVWRLIDEVYSEHLVKGPLRSEVKEIRATWRKAGFKSDRPKKPHRRHGSKGSNSSTTTSNSTLGTAQKRERGNKAKDNPGPSAESAEGNSAAALTLPSPPASALWWCDVCGWNSEAASSSSVQCGACKVKVHKTCAGCNWGTRGLCQLCSTVAETEGASIEDMRQFGGELVSERSPCQICGQNYIDCTSDSGESMRIGLYMVGATGGWSHGICKKYTNTSAPSSSVCQLKDLCGGLGGASVRCAVSQCQAAAHALCAAFRFRLTAHEPSFLCDPHLASGSSPISSSTGESESHHETSTRYKRNKIQLVDSPIASKRRRRRSDVEIPKPTEAPRPAPVEVEEIRLVNGPPPRVSAAPTSVAAPSSAGPSHSVPSERRKISAKIAAALGDPTDAEAMRSRLTAAAKEIEERLFEREASSRGGYLSLVRQFKKFLSKADSVPRMKLRKGEVDGAYVGGLEPWELQDEESIEERRRLDKKNMRMVTLGDIPREVDDDQPLPSHDGADASPQEGLSVGPNGLPVMPPAPTTDEASPTDVTSADCVNLIESDSDFDAESSDSEATKERQRLWWET